MLFYMGQKEEEIYLLGWSLSRSLREFYSFINLLQYLHNFDSKINILLK